MNTFFPVRKTFYSLIADIIDKSPDKKMSVAQIYNEISKYFPPKEGTKRDAWKNSVRHALSFKRIFVRIKDGSQKRGCLWTINEDYRYELQAPRTKRNCRAPEILAALSKQRDGNKEKFFKSVDLFLNTFYCKA